MVGWKMNWATAGVCHEVMSDQAATKPQPAGPRGSGPGRAAMVSVCWRPGRRGASLGIMRVSPRSRTPHVPTHDPVAEWVFGGSIVGHRLTNGR